VATRRLVDDWAFRALIALAVLTAIAIVQAIVWEMHHPCIRSHVGRVHHEGYWETIKAGNVDVPVWHEPYDTDEEICDERR
jgi:hypothetical protein